VALRGITTQQVVCRSWAAQAKAAPWLPDEWVITPRCRVALFNENSALQAPRALNAPIFCRFSVLKISSQPTERSISRLVIKGVR